MEFKKVSILFVVWLFSLSAWAFETVDAVDQAAAQLVRDGSAIEQTMTKVAISNLTYADLKTLDLAMTAYEQETMRLASGIQLSLSAVEDVEYGRLLDNFTMLSNVMANLMEGLLTLAQQVEGDAAYQYQNTFESLIRTTLRLSDDIGLMADRILFTEEQIGLMADRIGEMADRILETQRIQNENIARVQEAYNALLAKLTPAVASTYGF